MATTVAATALSAPLSLSEPLELSWVRRIALLNDNTDHSLLVVVQTLKGRRELLPDGLLASSDALTLRVLIDLSFAPAWECGSMCACRVIPSLGSWDLALRRRHRGARTGCSVSVHGRVQVPSRNEL